VNTGLIWGAVIFASTLTIATVASAQTVPLANPLRDDVDDAVDLAVRFLIQSQQENGAIRDKQHDTTMTALAVMAMASVGHQPSEDSAAGKAMRRGIDFVLLEKNQNDKGYFGRGDGSRMYGHGIITLMLTEMVGMGADSQQDAKIHAALKRAIDLILSAQQVPKDGVYRGGWRYEPDSRDSDLSVSVWQLMALRSAKNDGMEVPTEAIDLAVDYLVRSFASGRRDQTSGGFAYIPRQNNPTFAMTSAGLLAMQVCGRYEADEVRNAADWLLEREPKFDERFFFYGCYYYAQGMHQRGGRYAEIANEKVKNLLLTRQRGDGSWESSDGQEKDAGLVYSTSLGILSLSVKHHFLPIYQR
jgi:hypothetical protein